MNPRPSVPFVPSVLFPGLLASCLILLSGCQSWPKDAYIQGAKSTVNTPWGPSTMEADMIATGSAARNISLPESPTVSTVPKKK